MSDPIPKPAICFSRCAVFVRLDSRSFGVLALLLGALSASFR